MHIASVRLTVLFEDPFWIGIYERTCDGQYEVCKITFGTEPKDYEVFIWKTTIVSRSALRFRQKRPPPSARPRPSGN